MDMALVLGSGNASDMANALLGGVDNADALAVSALLNKGRVLSSGLLYNGLTWDRARTPNIFRTSAAITAAGATAVWTPAGGKKFRLMAYAIDVSYNAALAAGGLDLLKLQDAATDLAINFEPFIPAAALTAGNVPLYSTGWCLLGNGILSSAANNVLNLNVATALTSGAIRVRTAGTEE